MRDLGVRLLIGLAVIVVGVMGVGYAFIFTDVATPVRGELATLDVPADPGVAAEWLGDGRPVFVTHVDGEITVVDARASVAEGGSAELIGWCAETGVFSGPLSARGFDPDGTAIGTGPGLTRFGTRLESDGARVVVERGTTVAAARGATAPTCAGPAIAHEPDPNEVFDPSVAADIEPPGWIWLSGTLRPIGGQALLCDGVAATIDCANGAVARGIDPATIPADGLHGLFIGVVRDGAIEGLALREAR